MGVSNGRWYQRGRLVHAEMPCHVLSCSCSVIEFDLSKRGAATQLQLVDVSFSQQVEDKDQAEYKAS